MRFPADGHELPFPAFLQRVMSMYELSVKTHFSAAHHLRNYQGKCADPHGHNWEVEVFVAGDNLNGEGLLVDFRFLKDTVKEILGRLDHADLNKLESFGESNPTSENIARHIYEELSATLKNADCSVSRVLVRETTETSASYTAKQ